MTSPLVNKRIVLGVTGSIAAYKAAELASKLTQEKALVDVILTESGTRFISPLTFQSVTGRKAYVEQDLWGGEGHVTHVGIGHAADLMVIAPASANTIARLAQGIGDNLLTLTALAARCPLMIAPAMDVGMYAHAATQHNVAVLKERGAVFVGPVEGHLASGLVGLGRFVEPKEILGHIRFQLAAGGPLKGKRVLVSAGGTQEPIDPVRLITNRSSGKQGYAIALAAIDAGADVILVTAPTHITPPIGCKVLLVKTAAEMAETILEQAKISDVLIMAAAVSDFRPAAQEEQKIKKSQDNLQIELVPAVDILSKVAAERANLPRLKYVIGFAAESEHLLENAQQKLHNKRLDLIVANDISMKDAGFEVDTNRVTWIMSEAQPEQLPLMSKMEVAEKMIDQVSEWFESEA